MGQVLPQTLGVWGTFHTVQVSLRLCGVRKGNSLTSKGAEVWGTRRWDKHGGWMGQGETPCRPQTTWPALFPLSPSSHLHTHPHLALGVKSACMLSPV